MNKDNKAYLLLILDSFTKIHSYVGEMSYNDFVKDGKTQSAVIMQLQVVGELAKKIPEEIKNDVNIPWKEMAGLRDLVAHDYFNLDISTVWYTVEKSVVEAEMKIKKYLENRV